MNSMSKAPLFSFVATSRNDDHGGDVLRRTQSFVRLLAEQAKRHQVRVELVLVDWNPPASRAPLAEVLAWPAGCEWFEARTVTFPQDMHRQLRNSSTMGMFQMIAKNVGIRRAKGDYMIATNIDIVFSDELFVWLKTADLQSGVLYRSDRWDIPNAVQLDPDLDSLLTRARRETIRKNLIDGTHVWSADGAFTNTTPPAVDSFMVDPIRWALDKLVAQVRSPQVGKDTIEREIVKIRDNIIEDRRRYYLMPRLHTNGCGDFTMMHRQTWAELRGYPEWNIFSWAIDAVFLFQAHFNGIPIIKAPDDAVHYHIEHDHGSGWSPEGAASLWQRLQQTNTPYLDSEDFKAIVYDLEDHSDRGEFAVYCRLGWGFIEDALPESITAAAGQPALPVRAVNDGKLKEDAADGMRKSLLSLGDPMIGGSLHSLEQVSADGRAVWSIETQLHPWGYAALWDIADLLPADEVWLEIEYRAVRGRVSFGLLNRDEDDFVAQAVTDSPSDRFKSMRMRLKRPQDVSKLVCRNVETPEAKIELAAVWLLTEDRSAQQAADQPVRALADA